MKPLILPLVAAGALNSTGFLIDGNTEAAFAAFAATALQSTRLRIEAYR